MEYNERDIVDSLYRISSLTANTEDAKEALGCILEEVVRVFAASSASVSLINPDTNQLEIEVQQGLPERYHDLQLPLGVGVTGWVALHGKPLRIGDVTQEQRYFAVRETVRSEMAVPMEFDNVVVGVMNVDSEQADAFSENDLKILTLLTNEATRVVNQLWFIRQLQVKNEQLQSLVRTGQNLVTKRDLGELLASLTRHARRIMGCRLCALFLTNEDGETLTLSASADENDQPIEFFAENLKVGETAVGVAIQRRKQIEVHDLPRTEEHHFKSFSADNRLVSMLSTPLVVEDETIGVLNAYTSQSHRFNNDEKQIMAALASQGAVAIHNSRLYSRVFASEEVLRRNERLTTLGLLAAEIAHEIRNPLTVLTLLFESLTLDFAEDDPRHRDMEIIQDKLRNLEEIVSRVLSFGKNRSEMHSRWPLCRLVEDVVRLMRLKLEQNHITVEMDLAKEEIHVELNRGQLQQAILNLLFNALQAMPEGGTIRVETAETQRDGMNWATITLRDTGTGVPAEIQGKIFDSFLTARSEGTGLGLSITKRILKAHRGDIELLETGKKGTAFRLWLPKA